MIVSLAAPVLLVAFAALMILAAVRDVMSFTIANWISIALAALFVPAALTAGIGWAEAGLHLLTGVGMLLVGMAFFALRWLGGGDAKLLAAAAVWMGWPDVLFFLLVTAALGGALALVLVIGRRLLGPVVESRGVSLPILERTGDIPYGVAIAGAALALAPTAGIGAALVAAAI